MCGTSSQNWMLTLTSLVMFAGLVVASVVFLVRSFGKKPEKKADEKS